MRVLHARWRQIGGLVFIIGAFLISNAAFAQLSPVPNQAEIVQPRPSPEREALELQKLQRESDKLGWESEKLSAETASLSGWRQLWAPAATIIVAALALMGSILVAQWAYLQAMEQVRRESEKNVEEKIHGKRMELYPSVVKAMAPLAVYFPEKVLSSKECATMGTALRKWYFDEGAGLYLSCTARDAYFVLAAALTLATDPAIAATLALPSAAERRTLNSSLLRDYRKALQITADRFLDPASLQSWNFGTDAGDTEAHKIRDYVLLQELGSRFRTALIGDLQTRRLPGGVPAPVESAPWWRVFSPAKAAAPATQAPQPMDAAVGAASGAP